MKKLEYLLKVINDEMGQTRYLERAWLLSVCGIIPREKDPIDTWYPGLDKKGIFTVSEKGGEKIYIEDVPKGTAIVGPYDKVKLKKGDLINVKEDLETTTAAIIFYTLIFIYPYGDIIPFPKTKMSASAINKIAHDLLKEGKVTNDEHIRFENAASMLSALSQCFVPSATKKTIIPSKEVIALRDKLLEENKDKLNDPATMSMIQNAIADAYVKYISDDEGKNFLIENKSLRFSKMRSLGIYGAEPDFYDPTKISVMTSSLAEGWKAENLPMLINSGRGGSYSRGKSTAFAGAESDNAARVFHGHKMEDKDCGDTMGIPRLITGYNKDKYVGRYIVGKKKPIAPGELDSRVGEVISLRSPAMCNEPKHHYCKVCMGDSVFNSGISIGGHVTKYHSAFLNIFMSLMHTTELTTFKYSIDENIV